MIEDRYLSLDRDPLSKEFQEQRIATKSGSDWVSSSTSNGGHSTRGRGRNSTARRGRSLQMIKGMMNQRKRVKRMILMKRLNQ